MKKLFLSIVICLSFLFGISQEQITAEQARVISASTMAAFTQSTSFAYSKGITLDGFRKKLCGPTVPLPQGEAMIKTAYNYLVQGISKEQIK